MGCATTGCEGDNVPLTCRIRGVQGGTTKLLFLTTSTVEYRALLILEQIEIAMGEIVVYF